MATDEFFEDARVQSLVKIEIVRKYFWAWAKVMIPNAKQRGNRLAYVDLFCGPGRYDDGTESTPIHILKAAIREHDLRNMLITWFNDKNPAYIDTLREEISRIPDIDKLHHKQNLTSISDGRKIVQRLNKSDIPTLFFVDPWGYNGLSIDLINSSVKNWGCDCIFFFNYNRVNAALTNEVFRQNMASLFGVERAEALATTLSGLIPAERELTIIEAISQALNADRTRFVLPFRFRPTGKTSHHLIFVSKNVLGYAIMKEIMAKESSDAPDGVATFEYNPASERQPLLFALTATLDDLGDQILEEFAGRTMRMKEVYHEHNVGRPFIEANYKHVLLALEATGEIVADPPAVDSTGKKKRRANTFGAEVKVTFPSIPGR